MHGIQENKASYPESDGFQDERKTTTWKGIVYNQFDL
jgi:hypothetical protein